MLAGALVVLADRERDTLMGSDPVANEAGRNKGGYTVYFLDPDDITLEIIQPPVQR